MTKVKLLGVTLAVLLLAGFGTQVFKSTEDRGRRKVLLSVIQKDIVHERGKARVTISYKSTSTEWRQIEFRGVDPWNRTVSVQIGDVVYLEAWQQTANRIDCLITQLGIPGATHNDTRRSIGTVKCRLRIT